MHGGAANARRVGTHAALARAVPRAAVGARTGVQSWDAGRNTLVGYRRVNVVLNYVDIAV